MKYQYSSHFTKSMVIENDVKRRIFFYPALFFFKAVWTATSHGFEFY